MTFPEFFDTYLLTVPTTCGSSVWPTLLSTAHELTTAI